ncbi:MAG: capsular biosynthesis protein [Lachnospiraceae bacterium]|nr:capsular biosynthesis protein [Lachnospiraceae bacterium]MBR2274899.1 capsular biosynthesis protein [Lachnospiraceae bacterium]
MEKQNNRGNDVIEIDLLALLFEWRIHWRAILLSAVLAGVIGFALRFYFVNTIYESTSLLYVLTKSTSITSLADLQTGANLTQDYLIVTKGRPVLDKVIQNLKLIENYEELEKKVEVNNPTNTRFIEIKVEDEDPERARLITNEIADIAAAFIAEKMDQDPPSLVQSGYSDEEPVNHGLLFYSLAGAAIGAAIAMLLTAISFIFNEEVVTPEDVEQKIGFRILATLPIDEAMEG